MYMEKMKQKLIPAIEYSIQNPQISITQVSKIFSVDRHMLAKYKKDNKYQKYNIINQNDKNDEYIYYFDDNDIEAINIYLNNPTESYNKLKQDNPILPERRTLYRYLEVLGLEKTEGQIYKYHYNRDAFKDIKTEEDAYWLGFLTADGCIVENKWLYLGLAERDENHLIKFCKYLQMPDNEIKEIISYGVGGAYTKDNPICSIKICCLNIIKNLNDKGVMPRKSGKEKPYICRSKILEKAYIRGLIDGDGYLRSTQYGLGIAGSKEICEYVQHFITENICDISNNHIREHGIIFKLELNGRIQSTQIIQELYKNASIYLERKYQLYKNKYNDTIAVSKSRN